MEKKVLFGSSKFSQNNLRTMHISPLNFGVHFIRAFTNVIVNYQQLNNAYSEKKHPSNKFDLKPINSSGYKLNDVSDIANIIKMARVKKLF